MIFQESKIVDCYFIRGEPFVDHRGTFSRKFCEEEYPSKDKIHWVQENLSTNHKAGTLRGMHMQRDPYGEIKLVSCTRGRIFDVVVDMRRDSKSFGQWDGFELCEREVTSVLVSKGCAHGYLTLTDDTEVRYLVDNFYKPGAEVSLVWNDPKVGIVWPHSVDIVSDKDDNASSFDEYLESIKLGQ